MALLTGFESDQLIHVQAAIEEAWGNGRKIYEDPQVYRERMRYGFLGTIEYLISHIRPTGELNTDAAMQERQNEPGFNPELFDRAVSYLAEDWPDIASVIVRIGA